MAEKINPSDLVIRELEHKDNYQNLDFTDEESNEDPLHVHEFFHTPKVCGLVYCLGRLPTVCWSDCVPLRHWCAHYV